MLQELRAILGDGPTDDVLQALLNQTGGDVAAAANRFFDGGPSAAAQPQSACGGGGDEVMSTLFKTLEDVGRKLAGTLTLRSRPSRPPPRAPVSGPCAFGRFLKANPALYCPAVLPQSATSSLIPPQRCARGCSGA